MNDVPKKYALNSDIIHAVRVLVLRIICQRGFNVIRQELISLSSQPYLDTDIYKVSREIKKMKKTRSNILCT